VRSMLVLVGIGAACSFVCGDASAQSMQEPISSVELTPFAGFQYGGGFETAAGRHVSLDAGLDYGGVLGIRVRESWLLEALYSRQEAALGGDGGPLEVTVERLMGGLSEERGDGPTKYFGVVLLGATRFRPRLGDYTSKSNFTVGLGLGFKHLFSRNLGFRAEARGFYVRTESGGGVFCAGGCLFVFSSSGLWQGDLAGGLVLAF
jgi:hypothetical protein